MTQELDELRARWDGVEAILVSANGCLTFVAQCMTKQT